MSVLAGTECELGGVEYSERRYAVLQRQRIFKHQGRQFSRAPTKTSRLRRRIHRIQDFLFAHLLHDDRRSAAGQTRTGMREMKNVVDAEEPCLSAFQVTSQFHLLLQKMPYCQYIEFKKKHLGD